MYILKIFLRIVVVLVHRVNVTYSRLGLLRSKLVRQHYPTISGPQKSIMWPAIFVIPTHIYIAINEYIDRCE